MRDSENVVAKVRDALIEAGSSFSADKVRAYERAIRAEEDERARFLLQTMLENARIAQKSKRPLCDDTGIPHLILEAGASCVLPGSLLSEVQSGIREGLRALPGRPMGLLGSGVQRIDQTGGISPNPEDVLPAPVLFREGKGDGIRLHILLLGGGPAIRAKTYRVFHRHDARVVLDEIAGWAIEAVAQLGCAPCTLAIGIGRSHYEASALMLEAMADGNYDEQSDLEQELTRRVNASGIGPMGLQGKTSVLATFLKIGEQRASGVRIVCLRPCCCFEPRKAAVELTPSAALNRGKPLRS